MRIVLGERFQSDIRALPETAREQVLGVMLDLPAAFRDPSRHSGLGLRKIHSSGVWEVRVGFGLRLVFLMERDAAPLVRAGTHDDVRRFLKSL